jgi:beta-glucosidase
MQNQQPVTGLTRLDFSENFVWGTATAAYQIEGAVHEDGRGPSIWDIFSHTPGKTHRDETGDITGDHYHRYRQDVALMREIGLNSYRFSLSWSRILPNGGGKPNPKGLDFYERLVEELLKNDIQPYATLYHWDLPQALQDKGGWKNRATAQYFAEYADIVSRRLGDRVKSWTTLNEPWCSAVVGYIKGEHAPGEKNLSAGAQAAHHLLLAHGLALPVLRYNAARPDVEFGIVLSLNYVEPGDDSQQAQEAAFSWDTFAHRWFLDPLFKQKYPDEVRSAIESYLTIEPGDMEAIAGKLDFLGVNYYFRQLPLAIENPLSAEVKTRRAKDSQYTQMDWEVWPEGLYKLLLRLQRDYQPAKIYITENGAAFEDTLVEDQFGPAVHDPDRLNYLRDHFAAARMAIRDGVPLAGYFVWTLLDNFEWTFGFSRRFGIAYTDFPTQRRILKDSGRWLQQFLRG